MRLAAFILALSAIASAQVANQQMTLSANGKYLFNSITSAPVYLTGEDALLLATQLCLSDVQQYLADRANRGFNAVWATPIDNVYQSIPPKNCNGDSPFTGADFSGFNATYWAYVDTVVSTAAAKGITIFFNPVFAGTASNPDWLADLTATGTAGCCSTATWQSYGAFLGNRYKTSPNLVWLLGGDANSATTLLYTNLAAIATGILSADTNHLITLEACRSCVTNSQSSISAYGGSPPSFLNLNWSYDIQPQVTTPNGCPLTYSQSQTAGNIPPLEGEGYYELEHSMTTLQVREQGYWATLYGCYLGILFGNGQIWPFSSPNSGNGTTPNWTTQLASGGSLGEQYLGQLMRTRRHWLMAPDTTNTYLTAGFGSGSNLSVLSRSSDGQTMIGYIPNGNATTVTVNMAGVVSASSTVRAWWYNTRTGAATFVGSFANSGTHNFTPPDSNDWALVLDDASANLLPPGVGGITAPSSGLFARLQ